MEDHQIEIKYREEFVGLRNIKVKYFAEVTHRGLYDFKVISSEDEDILKSKIQSHVAKLNDKWDKLTAKLNNLRTKDVSLKEAELRTLEAVEAYKQIENILLYSLDIDNTIDWSLLINRKEYAVPNPADNLQDFINRVPLPILFPRVDLRGVKVVLLAQRLYGLLFADGLNAYF